MTNNLNKDIIILFISEILRYVHSLIMLPVILFSALWLILPVIFTQNQYLDGNLMPVFEMFPFLKIYLSSTGDLYLGNAEIFRIFGTASLIIYLVNIILSNVLKTHIFINLKIKLLIAFLFPVVLFTINIIFSLKENNFPSSIRIIFTIFLILSIISNEIAVLFQHGRTILIKFMQKNIIA